MRCMRHCQKADHAGPNDACECLGSIAAGRSQQQRQVSQPFGRNLDPDQLTIDAPALPRFLVESRYLRSSVSQKLRRGWSTLIRWLRRPEVSMQLPCTPGQVLIASETFQGHRKRNEHLTK